MPPTLISSSRDDILAFRRDYEDIIVKPLFGNGGAGVFHITPEDENLTPFWNSLPSSIANRLSSNSTCRRCGRATSGSS